MNTLRAFLDHTGAPWLILAVGAVYTLQSADLWMKSRHGLSLAFAGYAFSNIGLYLAAKGAL